MKKKINIMIQCPSCGGTGLYVGLAERDGAAVICYTCKGTGKYNYKYEYEEFTELKKRKDITRVYKEGYGYIISPNTINFENIGMVDMTREGVSYNDFIHGVQPGHIKKISCPLLADQESCHSIKNFVNECNNLNGGWINSIKNCKYQPFKSKCWERFEYGKVQDES